MSPPRSCAGRAPCRASPPVDDRGHDPQGRLQARYRARGRPRGGEEDVTEPVMVTQVESVRSKPPTTWLPVDVHLRNDEHVRGLGLLGLDGRPREELVPGGDPTCD